LIKIDTLEPTNINDRFFDSSYQYAWKGIIPTGLTEAEVDFIIELGRLEANTLVLDLMCGYGRHALELARRGIPVTAVDNLPNYTDEIRDIAQKEGLPVEAICSSVTTVALEGKYSMAICMGNSFAFFNREDAVSLLSKIKKSLRPGGLLLINSWMVAEIAIRHFKERDWHYAGEYKCLLEYKYLLNPSRIESEQTIISPDQSVEVLKGVDYIFSLSEMETLLDEGGFRSKAHYSTPRKKTFVLGDGRIYLLAEALS